jgi:AraC-like DNA-binding protein
MPPVYVPRMDSASADSTSVRARFLRGVDFIEEHLLEPVALADAAKQTGFSLHYFSRLFRVLTGSRSARICGGGA